MSIPEGKMIRSDITKELETLRQRADLSEEQRTVSLLTRLILAELVLFIIDGLIMLIWKDWRTLSVVGLATVLQTVPLWLFRHRYFQVGGLIFVVINIAIATSIAMFGQGIYDVAIVAFPIIFIFAGLVLNRMLFRLCLGIGLAAVCWLVIGENNGWIITQPLPSDPSHIFYLTGVITLLLVAAFAVDLLATNLHKSLIQSRQEVKRRELTEAELRLSEEKYRLIVEKSNDILFTFNPAGEFLYISSSIKQTLGYNPDDLIGITFASLIHPDDLQAIQQAIQLNTKNGSQTPGGNRYRVRHANGEWRWHNAAGNAIFDANGNFLYFVAISRDITEHKQAEEALKASEQKYSTLIEKSSDSIVILNVHSIEFSNSRLCEMTGYAQNEILGMNFFDLVAPEHLGRLKESYQSELADGMKTDNFEMEILAKDKKKIPVETSAQIIVYKDRSATMVIIRDITERKLAEEALKASEQNFRNSLDSSSIGIRISDKNDNNMYVNQAMLEIFGYKNIDEIRTNPPPNFYSPKDHASWVLRHERFMRGELMPKQVEIDIKRKDGSIRNLQVSMKDVLWDGKFLFETLYNDITELKQAEEARHESEERYRLIVENTRDFIFTLNSAGEYVYVSPSVQAMLGYNATNLIGRSFLSLVHPEDVHVIEKEIKKGTTGGYQISGDDEYRMRHVSGEWRWVISRGTRAVDTNGNFLYFIGIARDITKNKQAEEALKASEQNFRNSMDNTLGGIRISDIDNDTLYANQALLDIFGYKNIEEVKAKSPQEYYSQDSYAEYLTMREKYGRGEIIPDRVDIDIIRKDGTIRHLHALFKVVLWDGQKQFQTLYNDITEQKQAQEKIAQVAQEWRTTFDSITDLISIHDKDNRIIRVNKAVADLLHTTPQELVGKLCHEVVHGTKEPPANCPHLKTMTTGKSSGIETFNESRGVHFQEFASPIFNDKGEITGTVIVTRDVTQQKRMEEQLVMTDRLASIGELSSGIAHELNNPLTSVIGFSQLLMEGDVPENIREDLGTVYSEAQRAAAIVKNLLTFARKHTPVKSLSQVNAVIEDVLRLRAYEQKVNNIEIENHLDLNLPEIMIDHFQMQQVFLNIMVNGEFAMLEAHHQGKLIITTEKLDGVIKITFTDDGPGISEENLKHIFDPFFTTKEVGKGTGLGLSICHGIVTEHGGKIYASSIKGQGATFVIELPLINEQ
jgi:PAS domain S-box-containing protein